MRSGPGLPSGPVCQAHVQRQDLSQLPRCLSEFDFPHTTREMSDRARTEKLEGQVHGKRLTYKRVTAA